jgi:WD40 repeat protein
MAPIYVNKTLVRLLVAGVLVACATAIWLLWNPRYETLDGHSDQVTSLAFSPEGHNVLVSSSLDGQIGVWTLAPQTVSFRSLPGVVPTCLSFSPDGRQLAVGTHEDVATKPSSHTDFVLPELFRIAILDWKTAKVTKEVKASGGTPTALVYSKFRPLLVSISTLQLCLWNTDRWEVIERIDVTNRGGPVAGFAARGERLIFANSNGSIGVYDVDSRTTELFHGPSEATVALACREEMSNDVVVLTRKHLYKIDLLTHTPARVASFENAMSGSALCRLEKSNVYAVGLMELGEITFRRAKLVLIDGDTFAIESTFAGLPGGITTICVSDDEMALACSGFEPQIRVVNR